MNIINLKKEEFDKLKQLNIRNNREGTFYLIDKNHLFKNFITGDETISYNKNLESRYKIYRKKKFKTIKTLLQYRYELSSIEELIIPDSLVQIESVNAGCTMKYLKRSKNLLNILRNPRINIKIKIKYLIEIGTLLEKLKTLKTFPYEIHIGDLHEENILVQKHKIKLIDTDSIYISNNEPFCSKYLELNPIISQLQSKYPQNSEGFTIPSENSDIYCYIIMILNTLMRHFSIKISLNDFKGYLNYLRSINIPYNFLDCIDKIYDNENNENPVEYLKELPIKRLKETTYRHYILRTKF